MFLKRIEVLYHGCYFKRWARRLREDTFTREDAKVLALGTFGTDEAGQILGVHTIVTYDRPMLRKWGPRVCPLRGMEFSQCQFVMYRA